MICLSCKQVFEDYKSIALHIAKEKKGHRKGKRWAARYLLQQRRLDQKRDLTPRTPLTKEQKESKQEMKRDLCGDNERVSTLCPQCGFTGVAILPIEFTQDDKPFVWQKGGRFIILCESHLR